jgi:hypothetical protein
MGYERRRGMFVAGQDQRAVYASHVHAVSVFGGRQVSPMLGFGEPHKDATFAILPSTNGKHRQHDEWDSMRSFLCEQKRGGVLLDFVEIDFGGDTEAVDVVTNSNAET